MLFHNRNTFHTWKCNRLVMIVFILVWRTKFSVQEQLFKTYNGFSNKGGSIKCKGYILRSIFFCWCKFHRLFHQLCQIIVILCIQRSCQGILLCSIKIFVCYVVSQGNRFSRFHCMTSIGICQSCLDSNRIVVDRSKINKFSILFDLKCVGIHIHACGCFGL